MKIEIIWDDGGHRGPIRAEAGAEIDTDGMAAGFADGATAEVWIDNLRPFDEVAASVPELLCLLWKSLSACETAGRTEAELWHEAREYE